MSKIVTQRYEYACYDDAAAGSSLNSTPPQYPATLDQYGSTTVGNAAAGYGISNVNSSTGNAVTIALPGTAGGHIVCPASNTTMVSITFTAATVPAGTAAAVAILCGPGQTVSLPAAWVSPSLVFAACNPTGSATSVTPFAAQILWSF